MDMDRAFGLRYEVAVVNLFYVEKMASTVSAPVPFNGHIPSARQ